MEVVPRVKLSDDELLELSAVVANSAMNRERGLDGPNSYARELGVSPFDMLTGHLRAVGDHQPAVSWLDLCCGSGRALIEAAERLVRTGVGARACFVGVDLVDFFGSVEPPVGVQFVTASVSTWSPGAERRFDLITCVHGLHYVGDKLGVLARVASWLTDEGSFVANLDLGSVRLSDGRPAGRALSRWLKTNGFDYDSARQRLRHGGRSQVVMPYRYLGADDHAGPNYTGQPAVDSYYEPLPV